MLLVEILKVFLFVDNPLMNDSFYTECMHLNFYANISYLIQYTFISSNVEFMPFLCKNDSSLD